MAFNVKKYVPDTHFYYGNGSRALVEVVVVAGEALLTGHQDCG